MNPKPGIPASAETGTFTRLEALPNTYTSDTNLKRMLAWYLPAETLRLVEPHLTRLGEEAVSPQILEWNADAEVNQPYVKQYNVWGQRYGYDRLVTTEGWKQLGKWGAAHGVVSLGYDHTYGIDRRTVQYAAVYLYAPSSSMYRCPLSMTDGAAYILSQRLPSLPSDHVLHTVFRRLTSRGDDRWTSGQWMTERAGGSDVQNTETWASYAPLQSKTSDVLAEGDYLIDGFKFFSSATDANVAFLLAKTESGKLSTFIAPLRKTIIGANGKPEEVSNGVRIHRLKNKLGTKELPTAELELKGMRAHLVGELDEGVRTIAPLLNVTRIQTLLGTLSTWSRAISIAKNFAKCRSTVDQPLWLIPMHMRLLADLEVKHRGAMSLTFLSIALMGLVENNVSTSSLGHAHLPKDPTEAKVVFRVLNAICKGTVSKMSIVGVQECQEAMGGVGYIDESDEPEFNISRLLRNVAVYPIWEGTTNVLASELVRFLLKQNNLSVLTGWFTWVLSLIHTRALGDALKQAYASFLSRVESTRPQANLLSDARRVMFTFTWILAGALLTLDAERDGDGVAMEIARRWVLMGEGGVGEFVFRDIVKPYGASGSSDGDEHARWDCRIAWGVELPAKRALGHRSLSEASKL